MRLDIDRCLRELVDRLLDNFLERRADISLEDQAPSVLRFREMIGRETRRTLS
jgi:hypothetical protein